MRLVSLVTVFLGTLLSYSHLQAQNFSEILGRPTATSITMSILFDQKTEVFWEYGTNPGGYNSTTPVFIAAQDTTLMADFTGLFPDTKYYYRSRYRLSGTTNAYLAGAEHAFHTQRGAGSTFSFTIEADEHLYDKKGVRSIYQVTLANQAKDNPDFMLTLGDIFGDDHNPQTITSAQMKVLHKDYRQYLGQICHSVPLFICLGNHEGEKDYYLSQNPPDNMAVYATLWRKFYYANPYPGSFYTGNPDIEPYGMDHPENYYAWKWGDALFVVLDVYRDQCDTSAKPGSWNWSLGLPQYTWLKNTLESSTEQYKFVFAHHTRGEGRGGITTARYYEWGGYEADGVTWGFTNKRPGWEKPIHQLFVDNGVNIFFQGHDH
ncbi:MAG: metallophosphoesterase, partial [Bacteroidota bacterium]